MTNGEIVTAAYIELLGEQPSFTPSAPQNTQGLQALKRLYMSLAGIHTGYAWKDVVGVNNYLAGEDERVLNETALTIDLPEYVLIEDASGTADTYDETRHRPPLDGARVQIVTRSTGATEVHFFRSDTGMWVEATDVAGDDSPFNEMMDDYLIAILAVSLSRRIPGVISDETIRTAAEGRFMFRQKYRRELIEHEAVYY